MRQGKERNIKHDRESRQVAPVLAVHSSFSIARGRAWHGLHAHITENVMLATTCERAIEQTGRKCKKEWASVDIRVQSDFLGLCVTESCTIPLQHKRRQRRFLNPKSKSFCYWARTRMAQLLFSWGNFANKSYGHKSSSRRGKLLWTKHQLNISDGSQDT